MKTKHSLNKIALIISLSLVFAACGAETQISEEDQLATLVAASIATMEAESPADNPADEVAPTDTETDLRINPRVAPLSFGSMQPFYFASVPVILPPEFPVEDGQTFLVAAPITIILGEYNFLIDYGWECQGATACHYGVASGMLVASPIPVGSRDFTFEIATAEEIDLEKGILGYFVDYACGASCGDAQIWFLYGNFQYMLGLKAGAREALIDLANAAILNSIP